MYLPTPPSPLRLPVAVVLGLVVPPLGPIAWIALSGSHRPLYWRSGWIRSGFFLIIGAVLPLLGIIAATAMGLTSDPNPNPIGLGLLFFFGSVTGMVLIIIGVFVTARREPSVSI